MRVFRTNPIVMLPQPLTARVGTRANGEAGPKDERQDGTSQPLLCNGFRPLDSRGQKIKTGFLELSRIS
jgi:hypothetical protein